MVCCMDITKQIKKILDKTEDGIIMTPADFGVSVNQQPSLIVALNRLVANGKLKRLSKGKYYKPIQSQYFGEIPPDTYELVKDFILKEGKRIGYITGTNAFSRLGLTTQISGTVLIGTNTYRRPLRRGIEKIAFVLQPNPICEEDMDLYVILDALRFIQRIPATTPSEAVEMLLPIIKRLPKQRKNHLQDLALAYTPSVRALLGAMCEQLSIPCKRLKNSLNGTTYYRLHIDDDILSTKSNWRII